MNAEDIQQLVRARIGQAVESLEDAKTLLETGRSGRSIVNRSYHSMFYTTESKARLSVIDVLHNGQPSSFRLNEEALGHLETAGVSWLTRQTLRQLPQERDLDPATLQLLLEEHLPGLGAQARTWILDATAVEAYHAQTAWPVVRLLICNGAAQFTWVTAELALCWVREGRHYKKLLPYVAQHRRLLQDILKDFWGYYDDLLADRWQPSPQERALDERIAITRGKKAHLLMVLEHPEIPLHNNPAELGCGSAYGRENLALAHAPTRSHPWPASSRSAPRNSI